MIAARRIFETLMLRATFVRYMLASVCALSADMGLFLLLSRAGTTPMLAAFAGYVAGLALHWILSSRFVFIGGGRATHKQRAAFVGSALVGLAITVALVGSLTLIGVQPAIAKMVAVVLSFLTVYAIRRYGIFQRG